MYLKWCTIFNKVARPETLLIVGLHCACFPENFAKLFGTSILYNIFFQLKHFLFQIEYIFSKTNKTQSSSLSKVLQKIDDPKVSMIGYLEKH